MKIGIETVAVMVATIEDETALSVQVTRTKDKVLCKVDYEGLSDDDIMRVDSMSWTDEHLDQTAQEHAERHVYSYLEVA